MTVELPTQYIAQIAVNTANIEVLKENLKEIKTDLQGLRVEQARELTAIRSTLDQAKGGWKAGLAFASFLSIVAGGIGWVVSHFRLFGGGP